MTSPRRASRRAVLAAAGSALLAACTGSRGVARTSPRGAPAASSSSTATASATPPTPVTISGSGAGARVVRHADTGRSEVALTFHGSGDPALALRLLTEAERADAAITVFAVGNWLQAHPELAGRILHGGHALGNHTYTHPTLHRLPAAGIRAEVSRCAAVLRRLTGSPGAAFRPSGGPTITPVMVDAATAAGYPLVLGYDVDPADNRDPGSAAVTARVLAGVRPGSVVSLHLGHVGTVQALPAILTGLHDRGLRPVTAPQLVAP